ncbi:MAG: hypothetical protein KY475_22630 [Planctomycetes bacterium]|nr:hypothetical protein [Planctomycetota bacterium]
MTSKLRVILALMSALTGGAAAAADPPNIVLITADNLLLRTGPDDPFLLFDLETDIGERQDLAAEHPELLAKLRGQYAHWEAALK